MTERGNYTNDTDTPIHETTLTAEMRTFDNLDPRLRAFLRDLPRNFASEPVYKMLLAGMTVDEIIESGRAMLARLYGSDWKPI